MGIINDWLYRIANEIASRVVDLQQVQPIITARAYRTGSHAPQLKVKAGQFDDNITLNFAGLVVSRIDSQMFGGGVKLDFEGEVETEQEKYVNAVLEANKQEILFHRAGLSASEAGTGYIEIIPNGVIGKDGVVYPRIHLVDPAFVAMDTLPEDYEIVIRYTITYKFTGADGKEHARKRVIEHQAPDETGQGNTWTITDMEMIAGGRWEVVDTIPWPFDFAPILHWQNLPSVASCYGEPDLNTSLIELNDRINFLASNISKVIRYYAHPFRIGRGVSADNMQVYDSGPDKMLLLSDPESGVDQLEALGDMAASLTFLQSMRQAFFDTSRTVDIDSIGDKLGTLTNFGLRVLYADNLAMIATHRELFGDMFEELARRLQILNNMQPVACESVWPDFLPVNEKEVQTALEGDLRMGVASKQTVSTKRGYNWDDEQERIDGERASEDNIGAALLRGFNGGGGGFGDNRGVNA